MAEGSNYSLADIGALMNRNDYRSGWDNDSWLFILFLLVFGNNGWGNNGWANNGALTRAEMTDGFNNQSVLRKLDGITQGLCDGFYAQNTTMLQGFNGVEREIANNRFASQQCCCETNRNIDALRYDNSKNTCEIVRAIEKDGESTRALITANKIEALQGKLQEKDRDLQTAYFQLSQLSQNETLINRLQPTPKPAYITCSPYQAQVFGFNGCGGCGF